MATVFQDRLARGRQFYEAGDYGAAVREFDEATAANPTSAEGWRLSGFAKYSLGLYSEAGADLTNASALEPDNPDNHFGLGMARQAVGDMDGALSEYESAMQLRPDHAHAKKAVTGLLTARGRQRLQDDDPSAGENDLVRAIKLDRKNPEPVQTLAKHFLESGQRARAVRVVEQALGDMPSDPTVKAMAQHLGVRAQAAVMIEAEKKDAVQKSQQKPCPACGAQIMEWASVCPRCNTQIAARASQFAGRVKGSNYTWQEIAYKIVAGLWVLNGAYTCYQGYAYSLLPKHVPGFDTVQYVFGAIYAALGLGLIFEVEWIQFVAKIVCYLGLGMNAYVLLIGVGTGQALQIAYGLFMIALMSFQIYLFREVGDA